MDNSRDIFNQALNNFTMDVASGGAIRYLAKLGYTVNEIADKLTYPAPIGVIKETVWKYYLNEGIIRLDWNPLQKEGQFIENVEFVKDTDAYGRTSFRRVVTKIPADDTQYIACDFGKELYVDENAFMRRLSVLDDKDREYILGLPWPVSTVYHIADDRMKRIADRLQLG
ncbi:MAG: hypothetical protein MJ133_09350 [Lachnospiraceae bacterium]|nr:hypothetical protein [Lachnospiraceae bacterium]